MYSTGEQARALVAMERAERELVGKLAEQAHRMGVEDRQMAFVEAVSGWLDDLLNAVAARLGFDPGSEPARLAIVQALDEMTGGRDG